MKKTSYERVEALRKKFPDASMKELLKKAGATGGAYYSARKSALKRAKAAEPKPKTRLRRKHEVLQAAPAEGRMVLVMGTPDQIRQAMAGLA